ncbi:hypothetical protein NP233_g12442 [Leucocoprinus birnbaumii]|uniref:Fe2OG dioxygenase domain-containing protein n=1 Tax=Leucocoprinus birnbaumii TaxID=56174 RepID=A0AAD5VEP8_9AGAR|nr:hypothetical protein NP233_g12442 [Leucocoprinus birnbaumii]
MEHDKSHTRLATPPHIATNAFCDIPLVMEHDYIQRLRDTLKDQERDHEPWTSGVVNLKGSESLLFYKCKDGTARVVDLAAISQADIDALVDACEPAPFGRGPESVLDDTYRKALKLDETLFAWRFNPDSGNFIAQLAQRLCPWDTLGKGFRAEATKLNIYSEGGFFKAHQDTPRSETMFGSLVFTFDTPHTGGNLVLRHRTRSLKFDAPSLLASEPSPSVAYVAFYSDVEHEVLKVTSGSRITITYNLYFDPSRAAPILPSQRFPLPENPFMALIKEVSEDASFTQKYKYLGFGLEYKYPSSCTEERYPRLHDLKGPDAFVFRALQDVGLVPRLHYLYESQEVTWGEQFDLLLTKPLDGREECSVEVDQMFWLLDEDPKAKIVWRKGESEETLIEQARRMFEGNIKENRDRSIHVEWVTEPTKNLAGHTHYEESGNEPIQEIYYYQVCIVVGVGDVSSSDKEDSCSGEDNSCSGEDDSCSDEEGSCSFEEDT